MMFWFIGTRFDIFYSNFDKAYSGDVIDCDYWNTKTTFDGFFLVKKL